MKKLLFMMLLVSQGALAQKYKSDVSHVRFYSHSPLEDIEAVNKKAQSVIDTESGAVAFAIVIKDFAFEQSLMQEHFNENYMESEKYPKSIFKGKIVDWDNTPGEKTVDGVMEIHGVKKPVKITGTMSKKGDQWIVDSKFIVKLEDYKVKIPKAVVMNIATEVEVTIHFEYKAI